MKGVDVARVLLLAVAPPEPSSALLRMADRMEPLGRYGLAGWTVCRAPISTLRQPRACSASSSERRHRAVPAQSSSWDGPRELRRLAWLVVLARRAGRSWSTLTRAPIIATALMSVAVVLGLVAVGRIPRPGRDRRDRPSLSSPPGRSLTSSQALSRTASRTADTVDARAEVQRVSVRARRESALSPATGTASFDEVRDYGRAHHWASTPLSSYEYEPQRLPDHTSSSTAPIGLDALRAPVARLRVSQAISRALSDPHRRACGSWSGAIAADRRLSASAQRSNDFRFFSLAQALPWMFARAHPADTTRTGDAPRSTS